MQGLSRLKNKITSQNNRLTSRLGPMLLLATNMILVGLISAFVGSYRSQRQWEQVSEVLLTALALLTLSVTAVTCFYFWRHYCRPTRWRTLEHYLQELAYHEDTSTQTTLAKIKPLPAGGDNPILTRGWNRLLEILEQLQEQLKLTETQGEVNHFFCGYDSQRLLGVLDSFPDGVILTDPAGLVQLANRRCQGNLSRPLSSLIGKSVIELFDNPAAQQQLQRFITHLNAGSECAFEIIQGLSESNATNTSNITKKSTSPTEIAQAGGTILTVTCKRVGGDRDHSDILLILRDTTQQTIRQASQQDFIAHVSHELRNPLANIRAYAESLLSGMMLEASTQKEAFNVINEETIRLTNLVNDVLDLTRMETGAMMLNRAEVVTERLISRSVNDVQAMAAEKAITIQTNYHPKLPNLYADRDKLAVALNNLLTNAIKYTPRNGTVFVETSVDENNVYIKVADTGIGIGPEDCERVFDKFYRVPREETLDIPGSGLGLATTKEIITRHGGVINLTSKINKGTEFTIVLPLQTVGPVLGPRVEE
ncbi:MAG: PAS domain-containing protein [Sedimentisphaerales bacterium]|nr:PAS domain-containing protein [Sedimentisphaerales bacterium]